MKQCFCRQMRSIEKRTSLLIFRLFGGCSFERSCVNSRVSAKETDKSTTPLNNSKHSAVHSPCQLLKLLTALLICVLWLYPIGCVLNDQNEQVCWEKKEVLNNVISGLQHIPMTSFSNVCRPCVVIL